MSGTIEGGKKAALKNMQRDPDFYRKIGSKGGQNGNTGGFARRDDETPEEHRARVAAAGKVGGRKSRRTKRMV